MSEDNHGKLTKKAYEIRQAVLAMCINAKTGHVTSSFSCIEILVALYYGGVLRFDPRKPEWSERDRFILSKGQASPALYAVLADCGFYAKQELKKFAQEGGIFGVHLQHGVPGVEITSGSLGQGFGIAAGLALGLRMDRSLPMVFALLGDGECYEGSVWETAMFAAHHNLNNLIAIVDRNFMCATDFTEDLIALEPMEDKWRSFGWDVARIDGHDFSQLLSALGDVRSRRSRKPKVIIADTIKGEGIECISNVPLWHGIAPTETQAQICQQEFKEEIRRMSAITQRDAFWNEVYEIAKRDRNTVIVSADMGAPSLDKFRRDFPAQFINVGIAEQNAITLAAGLALTGKRVFAYAIAPFIALRCLEQIRVACGLMQIPITIVGVGAGFGYEDSGPTHHLVEDIAVMRAIPHIIIHSVSDSTMARHCARIAYDTPACRYIRLERKILPDIYTHAPDFTRGLTVIHPQKKNYIIATGAMTYQAIEIARRLGKKGFSVGVIDAFLLPLNAQTLLSTVRHAEALITLEEHFLAGGLGSAVSEILTDAACHTRLKRLGLSMDRGYCYQYGGRERLRAWYGLNQTSVEKTIAAFLKKKTKA